jgi:SNF family Na+-dependent transporter
MEKIIESIYALFGVLTRDVDTSYIALSITMLLISISGFIVHYYVIDNVRWDRKENLWTSSAVVAILTILVSYLLILVQNPAKYYLCVINGLFSVILMVILSSIPLLRNYSTNCKHTTFWKP